MYLKLLKLAKIFVKIFFNVNVIGKENIPKSGGFILCANHKSLFDAIILASLFDRQIYFIGKSELFDNHGKLFSKLLYSLGAFPVKRETSDIKSLKHSIQLLHQGKILGIFPQGRCVKGNDISFTAKAGVALIANKANADILPVSIYSNGNIRLFKKITIRIGLPISYKKSNSNKREELKNNVSIIEEEIRKLLEARH